MTADTKQPQQEQRSSLFTIHSQEEESPAPLGVSVSMGVRVRQCVRKCARVGTHGWVGLGVPVLLSCVPCVNFHVFSALGKQEDATKHSVTTSMAAAIRVDTSPRTVTPKMPIGPYGFVLASQTPMKCTKCPHFPFPAPAPPRYPQVSLGGGGHTHKGKSSCDY